ncbi:MAG: TRAP transporter small permease [Proteobacteria bacterium]|nr:TRAP transporter small permease [Pseudomonadota bacterium]
MREVINRLEEWLMAALLAFMTVLTFVQVVMRYVFNTGWVWSLEATTYSFAALVLIGMSYGVRTKTHIATDLLTRKLSEPLRHYVAIVAIGACLVYALLMLYGSTILVDRLMTLGNNARDIAAPKWLLTATMPLGFALLTYRFLEAGWLLIRRAGAEDGS